jgi:hypothetical protein
MIEFKTVKKTHLNHTFVMGVLVREFYKSESGRKKPKFEEETNGSNYYETTT